MVEPVRKPDAVNRVFPPYPDHKFFDGADRHPFDPTANGMTLANAWWLIEASIVSYSDEKTARSAFVRVGFPEVTYLDRGGSTQCYVASNDAAVIVAVRGSEVFRGEEGQWFKRLHRVKMDWCLDLDVVQTAVAGGRVHRGFLRALNEIWDDLARSRPELTSGALGGRPVFFTGHSLGAAVATLAAWRHGRAKALYTYGSPLVGSPSFKASLETLLGGRIYRFVNDDDIVTSHPQRDLLFRRYAHIGAVSHIRAPAPREGRDTNLFLDHMPTLYAMHLWNAAFAGLALA